MALDVTTAAEDLADTTVAPEPSLTAELATVVPYDLPWAWANAFDAAGRAGLLYRARFALEESVALFGDAGEPRDAAPAAARTAAMDRYTALPPAFRAVVGTVGPFDALERGAPP